MTDIPDWIEDRLDFVPNRTLQERHVVEALWAADRPYMSKRQIHIQLGGPGEVSGQTVKNRLNDLAEVGVVNSDEVAGGQIFWIENEKSNWPIPPDVEVEASANGLTLTDLRSREHLLLASLATLLLVPGSLLMAASVFVLGSEVSIPLITGQQLLFWGFSAIGVSSSLFIGALVVWVLDRLWQNAESLRS